MTGPSVTAALLHATLERSAAVGVSWSVLLSDADSGERLLAFDPDRALRTASVGKLLLLVEVARRLRNGTLDADEPLTRTAHTRVADSGIWQHLSVDTLSVEDAARLVGMASDNWATNVLLERVGGVAGLGALPDAVDLRLHDRVRDDRTPSDPQTLSTGSASACVSLLTALRTARVIDASVSHRVLSWLRGGLDLSMVASAFGLDPLAHTEPDRGLSVTGKTGTDVGIRADIGIVDGPAGAVVYACVANWNATGTDPMRDAVLTTMREIGYLARTAVTQGSAQG